MSTLFAAEIVEGECLQRLNDIRAQHRQSSYVSLVFSQNQEQLKSTAQRDLSIQIVAQIEANAILTLSQRAQQDLREDIRLSSFDIWDESFALKEYICRDGRDWMMLSLLPKERVRLHAKERLATLKEQNHKDIQAIQSTTNLLKKAALLTKMQHDYLPYLMILPQSKIHDEYFVQTQEIQKLYNNFYANTHFFIEISYPENPFYPVEERVDEVRHELLEVLKEYALYATKLPPNGQITQRDRDIGIITIELLDNSSSDYSYTLEFRLSSLVGEKKYPDQSAARITYPRALQAFRINFVESFESFHKEKDIVWRLGLL